MKSDIKKIYESYKESILEQDKKGGGVNQLSKQMIDTLTSERHKSRVMAMRQQLEQMIDDLNNKQLSRMYYSADDHLDKAVEEYKRMFKKAGQL